MIAIATTLIGALWGVFQARRLKGSALDIAQYAAGFAIVGLLVGVFLSIALARLM